MNDIVELTVAHPKSHLDELRGAFGVPVKYTDKRLLEALIGIVIDKSMNANGVNAEELQKVLTDDRMDENWL
ncbi:MAG: hypothetical protein KJI69_05305 [Patescibacteria group bacterium]|nr:hypothetical protein [Patescibacteria group bacterium]